jgi:hypothetical protein
VLATYPSPIAWHLLEDCLLCALQTTNQYTIRACVGKLDVAYTQFQAHALGQCTGKSRAADSTSALLNGPALTGFYSSDRFHPLYDMIYKVGNIYYAFQVTIGKSHDAKQRQINNLVQQLQIGTAGRELKLYYAVHEGVFDNFVTKPVTVNLAPGVSIFHLKLEKELTAIKLLKCLMIKLPSSLMRGGHGGRYIGFGHLLMSLGLTRSTSPGEPSCRNVMSNKSFHVALMLRCWLVSKNSGGGNSKTAQR